MTIPKIVTTGGPCAGKTTAQAFLVQKLSEIGYYPILVPEAPTLLMNSRVTPVGNVFDLRSFQERVITMTRILEEQMELAARASGHPKPILICDRGIMDAKAYMPAELFTEITQAQGIDTRTVCDGRYVGVFHLRSAAIGAEEFYTCANNSARRENLTEAREADERTLHAWIGHTHVAIIGNEGRTFEEKLHTLWKKICRVLGEPVPLEIERRFLIKPIDIDALKIPYRTVEIEQVYIRPIESGTVLRIRKRGDGNVFTYFETTKREVRPGVRIETERLISAVEYATLLPYQEPHTRVVKKRRTCFVYNDQYFELDTFAAPHEGLTILELELTEENDRIDLPPFIEVLEEVTMKRNFSNRALAVC